MKQAILKLPAKAIAFVLALSLLSTHVNLQAAEMPQNPPTVSAPAFVVMDRDTGLVVYQRQMDEKHYPASITKVMNALLTLEYAEDGPQNKMEERITFSREAVFSIPRSSSNIAMDEGETLTIRQAMYGMMLASANEVANALGEHIAGSSENFAAKMTERAKELGANNTNFVNVHGLYDANHYTTAYDMALIMRQALTYPSFIQFISTTSLDLPPTERQPEQRPLHNSHKMMQPTSPNYDERVVGGKTGYTSEAGNTLVTYAEQDGVGLIVVVLQATSPKGAYDDTRALLDYGFAQYETCTLFNPADYEKSVPVAGDGNETLTVRPAEGAQAKLPKSMAARAVLSDNLPDTITQSVNAWDAVGTLSVTIDGVTVKEVPLVATQAVVVPEVEPLDFDINASQPWLFDTWRLWAYGLLGGLGLLAVLLLWLILMQQFRRRNRRTRRYKLRQAQRTTYRYRQR